MHRYERYDHDPILGRLGSSVRVQLSLWSRRPRPGGGAARRFVVFAQGRTGSTLLATLLNSHPDIQCDHEILSVPVIAPLRYVDRTARLCAAPLHGFRVKIYQLTSIQRMQAPGDFLRALHESGTRILHLRRENLLRQAVSNLYAAASQTYHFARDERGERVALQTLPPLQRAAATLRRLGSSRAQRPKAPHSPGAIAVDCAEVVMMMEKRLRYAADENRALSGLPAHVLSYERDLLDPAARQAALDRAFEYLGVRPVPVATSLVRSVTGKLEDTVSNLDELAGALRHTRFEHFLDDASYARPA